MEALTELNVEELAEKAISGDTKSLDKLISHYMKDMLYFAIHCANSQEAEDIVQNTCIRIYKYIHTLKEPDKFLKWALRIVHNEAMRHMAKSGNTKQDYVLDEIIDTQLEEKYLGVENQEFLPEEFVTTEDLRKIVLDEMSKLTERQKMCLHYYYFANFSRSEIAEITDLPLNQVATALRGGKLKLKELLERKLGKNFQFSVLPVGAVSVFTKLFQQEQSNLVSDQLVKQVTAKALKATATPPKGKPPAKTIGTKIIAGISAGVLVVGAVTIGLQKKEQPSQQESTPVVEAPQEKEKTIETLEDMIGEKQAGRLKEYTASSVDKETFSQFIKEIGAEVEETGEEPDNTYCIYILIKQDKRLLIATKIPKSSNEIAVRYHFDNKETAPLKLPQFILLFPTS